jgi:hypothetical protein
LGGEHGGLRSRHRQGFDTETLPQWRRFKGRREKKNLLRYAEAEPLYTRALAIREKVLGNDHPYTKATRRDLQKLRQLTAPATEVSRDSQSGAGDR